MELRYATPQDLVEALQTRGPGARAQLWQVLHEPVDRLMDELVLHALHSAETSLRTQDAGSFAGMGWNGFRAAVLLRLAKIVHQPHGGHGPATGRGGGALPESPGYHSDAFFRPCTQLGNHF